MNEPPKDHRADIKRSIGCFHEMIADTVDAPPEYNVARLYVLRHALGQACDDIAKIRGRLTQQQVFDEYINRALDSLEGLVFSKEKFKL